MSDHSTRGDEVDSGDGSEAADVRAEPGVSDGVACTEAYEQDGQVVLYDAENPLAWIEASSAVELGQMT